VTPCKRAYRTPLIAINGNIFKEISLLNNEFLEKSQHDRLVFALIFDGKLRYDANECAAVAKEKVRDRDYR